MTNQLSLAAVVVVVVALVQDYQPLYICIYALFATSCSRARADIIAGGQSLRADVWSETR